MLAFPLVQNVEAAKKTVDGVSNENRAPHLLSGSINNAQAPPGQAPSMGLGEGTQGRKTALLLD